MVELVLKPLDAALMAGRFNMTSTGVAEPSNDQHNDLHNESSTDIGDADADLHMTGDEFDVEDDGDIVPSPQIEVKTRSSVSDDLVVGSVLPKAQKKLLMNLYKYCIRRPSRHHDSNE